MENMVTVPAAYIEELRIVIKRLKEAENNCMTLLVDKATLQSPTAVMITGRLVFVDLVIACDKVEEIVKEYDNHIEDMIDNYTDNEF